MFGDGCRGRELEGELGFVLDHSRSSLASRDSSRSDSATSPSANGRASTAAGKATDESAEDGTTADFREFAAIAGCTFAVHERGLDANALTVGRVDFDQ